MTANLAELDEQFARVLAEVRANDHAAHSFRLPLNIYVTDPHGRAARMFITTESGERIVAILN